MIQGIALPTRIEPAEFNVVDGRDTDVGDVHLIDRVGNDGERRGVDAFFRDGRGVLTLKDDRVVSMGAGVVTDEGLGATEAENERRGEESSFGNRAGTGVKGKGKENGRGSTRTTVAAAITARVRAKMSAPTMRKERAVGSATMMTMIPGSMSTPGLTASRAAPDVPSLSSSPSSSSNSNFISGSGTSVLVPSGPALTISGMGGSSVPDMSNVSAPGFPPPGYRRQRAEGTRLRRVELPPARS